MTNSHGYQFCPCDHKSQANVVSTKLHALTWQEQGADKHRLSLANLVLTGHGDNAEFALDCATVDTTIASGGKDTNVWARPGIVMLTPSSC